MLMDPMGNIPKWVITMAQTYAAKAHLILATVLKERSVSIEAQTFFWKYRALCRLIFFLFCARGLMCLDMEIE